MKSGKNPPQNRLAAEEGHAQRFAVGREEFFLRQHAPHCARERTPQYQRKSIVEPDDGCGSGPHEIPDDAVIAVDDPAILVELLLNELPKLFGGPRGPVRLPIEGIKLDMRKTQRAGEGPGEAGFPNTTGANYNHAGHVTRQCYMRV